MTREDWARHIRLRKFTPSRNGIKTVGYADIHFTVPGLTVHQVMVRRDAQGELYAFLPHRADTTENPVREAAVTVDGVQNYRNLIAAIVDLVREELPERAGATRPRIAP